MKNEYLTHRTVIFKLGGFDLTVRVGFAPDEESVKVDLNEHEKHILGWLYRSATGDDATPDLEYWICPKQYLYFVAGRSGTARVDESHLTIMERVYFALTEAKKRTPTIELLAAAITLRARLGVGEFYKATVDHLADTMAAGAWQDGPAPKDGSHILALFRGDPYVVYWDSWQTGETIPGEGTYIDGEESGWIIARNGDALIDDEPEKWARIIHPNRHMPASWDGPGDYR